MLGLEDAGVACLYQSTGNMHVTSMFWHEGTSSLIASTRTDHMIHYGKCGGEYMYCDDLSDDEDDILDERVRPSRAIHEPTYFGATPWHLNSSTLL